MYSILLSKIEYGFPLIRERLNKIINKKMKVVVLPWAFPTELDYNKLRYEYFKEGENKYNKYINPLLEMGIEKENIKILNCYDTKSFKQFKNDIKNSDILLLPGGNPEMFFSKVVQETELLYEIKNYNGIIIGESAGACLQFKRYFITAKNNYYKYFAFYDGFGVLDDPFYIDVHSINNFRYINKLEKVASEKNKNIYAIFDDGAILYNRSKLQIELFGNVIKINKEKRRKMKYLGSRVLETDRLILRPTKEEDLKVIWTILCDKKVAEHYLVGKFNYDWEKEKVWQYKKLEKANNEDVFQWSIILKSENKCIGQASCQKSHDEFGNENSDNIRDVGWFLDSNYHGMGYGSEVAKAVLDYMFKEVQIDKIETCVATDNIASWKVIEKLGFHRTNKIKKIKYTILPEEVDCYCYEITREEYLNQ